MNLLDLILAARKGQTVTHFAHQFGLSNEQARGVLDMMVPLMGDAVVRTMRSPEGLATLLSQIASGQHERDQEAPDLFSNTRILSNGTGLLSLLFRNEATIRVVACYAGESARVEEDVVRSMMPYVATLYMAAMSQRSRKPLDQLAGRVHDGGAGQWTGPRKLAHMVLAASSPRQQQPSYVRKPRDNITIKDLIAGLSNLEAEEENRHADSMNGK